MYIVIISGCSLL